MTLFGNLRRAALAFPQRPALAWEGGSFSYGALLAEVQGFAAALVARGLRPGDRLALHLPNVPQWVIAYHGAVAAGLVPVSLSAATTAAENRTILADCRPRAAVTHADLADRLPLADEDLLPQGWILGGGGDPPPRFSPWGSWDRGAPLIPPHRPEPHGDAAVLYTSGTTGAPRGVVLTHAGLVHNVHAAMAAARITCEDVILCFLPLFHCFGQNHVLGSALRAGACVYLQRRFDENAALAAARDQGISIFYGVPTVYRRLMARPELAEAFRGARFAFSAASAMDPDLALRWREALGRPIHEGYGLTETSPFATFNHPLRYAPGTVGVPIDGVEVAVVDPEDRPLPAGGLGEVVIRGPNVMSRYLGRPQETAEALRGGWFHSGDRGWLDDEGCLHLVDRIKDMISVAGFKVWPREVEEALARGPGVAQVAVVGAPDADRGERVVAVVVPREAGAFQPEALRVFARQRLATYKVPAEIRLADALPISPSGKVLRRVLREKVASPIGADTGGVNRPILSAAPLPTEREEG